MSEEQAAEQAFVAPPMNGVVEVGTPEQIAELYLALAAAQGNFAAFEKTEAVKVTLKNGGSYVYHYAPLEALIAATRPALSAQGLAYSAPLITDAHGMRFWCRLLHKSGASVSTVVHVPTSEGDDIKTMGGFLTYMARYAYRSLLGLGGGEDADQQPIERANGRGEASVEASSRKPRREPEVPAQGGEQRQSPPRGQDAAPTAAAPAEISTPPSSPPPSAAPAAAPNASGLNPLQKTELAKLGQQLGATSAGEAVELVYAAAGGPVTAANFKEKLEVVKAAVAARMAGGA